MSERTQRGLWPVDWLVLGYLLAISFVIAAHSRQIPHAVGLLVAHATAIIVVLVYAWRPRLPGATPFRQLYPLPLVFACYRVMSILIQSIREPRFDAVLATWDRAIWGGNPTVWLERIQTPLLTELLQLVYSLFVPTVLAVALLLWLRRRQEYRAYAFLLTLGFLVSYVMYYVVPARGPRYFLNDLQTQPLTGIWLFRPLRSLLDALESVHYDCFPSGHVEMTVLAWWTTRRISARLSRIYLAYVVATLLATVYLRYHYTIDLLAGIVVAALVLFVAPALQPTPALQERQFQDEQTRDFARSK